MQPTSSTASLHQASARTDVGMLVVASGCHWPCRHTNTDPAKSPATTAVRQLAIMAADLTGCHALHVRMDGNTAARDAMEVDALRHITHVTKHCQLLAP